MNIYEKILAGLKTKFTGVDEATLQRIATKKSEGVTDENMVNSIVEGIAFQDVLTSYGDYRADGAQKIAVTNYEKKHNIKDGKYLEDPKTPPAPPKPGDPPQPQDLAAQIAAAMGTALKPLQDRLEAMDVKVKADVRNQQIEDVAKSFGIPEIVYKDKVIAEDADLNQYFTGLKQGLQNSGFQFAKTPEEGLYEQKGEISSLVEQIDKGTEELTKNNK